jgi:hypothetical protein
MLLPVSIRLDVADVAIPGRHDEGFERVLEPEDVGDVSETKRRAGRFHTVRGVSGPTAGRVFVSIQKFAT